MKDIVWSSILSVDVDEIDEDHRKLVNIFNILTHSLADGDSPEYLTAVLDELINCTIWHFSHEERLMLKYSYPQIDEHRQAHSELIEGAKELQRRVLKSGKSMAEDDVVYLERWLTEHIFTDDRRLGDFLSQVM